MAKYVGLMRGINVGGNRKIKMADLRPVVAKAGFSDVQTYVQSGNIVFSGDAAPCTEIEKTLEAACEKAFGFHTEIMVRDEATFRAEASACPYVDGELNPKAGLEGKFLHVAYLSHAPNKAKVDTLLEAYGGPEDITLIGNTLYIYYHEGSGRSDFSKYLTEKKLGASPTSRNWNTVQKLLAMLDAQAG
ncbi:DUF1697 domain-containing protein [Kordiimonas sp.]|uniref:DUF1697 domain-containing protein n=1 Tax=Kordiimonas sp. TaxID=1970157 RepID=UPI003A93A204